MGQGTVGVDPVDEAGRAGEVPGAARASPSLVRPGGGAEGSVVVAVARGSSGLLVVRAVRDERVGGQQEAGDRGGVHEA